MRASDVERSGVATVQVDDSSGNGRFDTLRVRVPLVSRRVGSYVIGAVLRAPDGSPMTRSRVVATWSTGPQTLEVGFDGRRIHAAQRDGPYSIELRIVAADTLQLTLDEQPVATTAAYMFDQFERPLQRFMPLAQR